MKHSQFHLLAGALLAAALTAPAAHAQSPYIWIDDKGMKQLSDQPPPPSVPPNRILRAPRNAPIAPAPAADSTAAPAADSDKAAADDRAKRPPTLAERNADFKKRQAEAASASEKAAQEAAQKSAQAANCESARSDQAALDSGMRMSTFDKEGQRSYLTDAQRAERSKQNKAILAGCAR
ncbi:hypothetical protein GCM10027277_03320 [Pseudoduganella ginsengisoli]|uniref:DUF4124 domain-containing protein n=1 Tax=Pseudoduganella ginsengisoli TaxID=1462440 RepID=A0A6L6Q4S4_9BURK|nr:DUF4124 domain-containing protein [Pseudoduganella ginsengisoli]MTW04767.1 DUF4124 domain-containing protein [Pseudoduganella ginsengisoli]